MEGWKGFMHVGHLLMHGRGVCARRGLGALEGLTWESANAQVRSGDLLSTEWRPPRGTDGTPHESVSDVLVRMRQVWNGCKSCLPT